MSKSSKVSKFHQKTMQERLDWISKFSDLNHEDRELYLQSGTDNNNLADQLIENSIGVMEVPLGVAVNFIVNGKDCIVPMAVEETSVIAAASNGAKLARPLGGFHMHFTGSYMIGQVQITNLKSPESAKIKILQNKDDILDIANSQDPTLVELGGGAYDLEVRIVGDKSEEMLIVHLLVDTLDAMGANATNTMAEKIAPTLEQISEGNAYLRIISNLADHRLIQGYCEIKKEDLGGEEVVDNIVEACRFANLDPYRAATNNKGIMNGISSVVLATGNDTRAIEAGAHAYAVRNGQYRSLTQWEKNEKGNLVGSIDMPLAIGVIGGATSLNPKAKANLKIMGVKTSQELSEIIGSVGLAQNLTALKALATEGVQKGHMRLHAKNVALMADATGDEIDYVSKELVKRDIIRVDEAKKIIRTLRNEEI